MKAPVFFAIAVALTVSSANVQAGEASAGETLYAETCAQCHGPQGRGVGSFPSVAGNDAEHVASLLEQYRDGERIGPNSGLMIPNAVNLSDEDITNLADYISTSFQ